MPLILLLLPSLYLLLLTEQYNFFLLNIISIFVLYSLIKSTKYSLVFLPLLWLLPAYLYYIHIYKSAISEQVLGIVLETNAQEAWSFLGASVYWYLFLCGIWCLACSYLCYLHYKQPIVWQHRSRYWVLVIGLIYFITNFYLQKNISDEINQAVGSEENFLVQERNGFLQEIKQTYPFGFFISLYDLWHEQEKIQQAFNHNKNFSFESVSTLAQHQKQVYVLVIGETSRRENWQLNGYARATNPRLSQQSNLVNFSDFLAISTDTRSAIPMMLTRKPAEQVYRFNFTEKSIISAFKEAGYATYWLSTQQRFGAFDTSTSVYAKEADTVVFLNKADYKQAGELDQVLVPVLSKIIKKDEAKQFIVLHTLGSHYNYAHRYPEQFNLFKPSLSDITGYSLQDKKYKNELLNSYDNSILYTDYVLNAIIMELEQYNIPAFLFYSSDHGEDIFDQECTQSGHGLTTKRNLEIASFAWYSEAYKKYFPEKVLQLHKNQHRKVNQTAIFPTLLDAAHIQIPNYGLNKSILKPFGDYPRLVLGGKNYDTTQKEGICQEVP